MIENIIFYNPQNRDMDMTISEIFGSERESVAKNLRKWIAHMALFQINHVTLIHTIMTITCLWRICCRMFENYIETYELQWSEILEKLRSYGMYYRM